MGKRIERDSRVAYWRPGGGLWGQVRPYYLSWSSSQEIKKVVQCSGSDVFQTKAMNVVVHPRVVIVEQ